jgi:non-reducing end alpha-L-arabinofuranosidase
MTNNKREFSKSGFHTSVARVSVFITLTASACSETTGTSGAGGGTSSVVPSTGGLTSTSTGGLTSKGGATNIGGVTSQGGMPATGGTSSGAVPAQGGANGGAVSNGGATTGHTTSAGGGPGAGGTTGGSPPTGGSSQGGQTTASGGSSSLGGASGVGGQVSRGGGVTTGGGTSIGGTTGTTGPCDIYQAGNTPCVAAHSTARALYGSYNGKLYQLRRADKTLKDISALAPGGYADSATQESFCAGTKCTISIIYDQSPQKNDLTLTSGGWIGNRAKEADAFGVKVKLNGNTVYGIHVPLSTDRSTGVGYRNNTTKGIATGDQPESMYMVANGKLYSNECCFDYGNATVSSLNEGPGTMEAIYFGNCTSWGSGDGTGPWVMADLEEGLFSGKGARLNAANKSLSFDYVTAILKGKAGTFAIKTGNAQAGLLTTMYEGARPSPSGLGSYDPMKKQGGIVLGTGGDNSFMGSGDFFEGAMTTGYATDATDAAIQANIVAAGYGK